MTVVFWILVAAAALPYLWGGTSSFLRQKQFGALDNRNPRAQQAQLTGAGARANAAQANAWEALAVFAPAAVLVLTRAPTSSLAPTLALVWLVARVLHGVMYLADVDKARSGCFAIALFSAVGLYLVGGGVI